MGPKTKVFLDSIKERLISTADGGVGSGQKGHVTARQQAMAKIRASLLAKQKNSKSGSGLEKLGKITTESEWNAEWKKQGYPALKNASQFWGKDLEEKKKNWKNQTAKERRSLNKSENY